MLSRRNRNVEKVGKTSIVEVLITATFEEVVQPVLPVLVVPKDVTPDRVHVSIVDTPGAMSQVSKVDEELKLADVIVLVYSVNDEETQKRISSYWLKKFRASGLKVPIILVGNKIDTRGGVADPTNAAKMEEFIKPIMDTYREVDVCIECSAKTVSNISEVFYFAQKAVLHPTGPLYDVDKHALKPSAAAALRRIFRICDKDRDGGLNDKELNDFQYTCFNVHLQPEELAGVKKVVHENIKDAGIRPDGSISVEGFIFLHTLFVQKGRLETTWIVLRKFGYDDNMRLVLDEKDKVKYAVDQSVELSAKSKEFLSEVFMIADKDGDGMLSRQELKTVFADYPDLPFSVAKPTSPSVRLTHMGPKGQEEYFPLEAFMARWALYVQDSPNDALLALLYIGYTDSPQSALKVTKSRVKDRYYKNVSREVLSVLVLGDNYRGKSDIIRGLAEHPATGEDTPGLAAAATIKDLNGSPNSKVLIMRDQRDITPQTLAQRKPTLEIADVICIAFDASSKTSFEYAKSLWHGLDEMRSNFKVPVVFVASVEQGQDASVTEEADALCFGAELPSPVRVSMGDDETANLYADLLGVATHPEVACPGYYETSGSSSSATIIKVAVGTLAVSGLLYGAKRLYDYFTTKPNTN